jgi:hypothetical protein
MQKGRSVLGLHPRIRQNPAVVAAPFPFRQRQLCPRFTGHTQPHPQHRDVVHVALTINLYHSPAARMLVFRGSASRGRKDPNAQAANATYSWPNNLGLFLGSSLAFALGACALVATLLLTYGGKLFLLAWATQDNDSRRVFHGGSRPRSGISPDDVNLVF